MWVLPILVLGAWLRSDRHLDGLEVVWGQREVPEDPAVRWVGTQYFKGWCFEASSCRGAVSLIATRHSNFASTWNGARVPQSRSCHEWRLLSARARYADGREFWPFGYESISEWSAGAIAFSYNGETGVLVPLWFVLALTTVPLCARCVRAVRRVHRRIHNRCPGCGYQLRDDDRNLRLPDRCPECGFAVRRIAR